MTADQHTINANGLEICYYQAGDQGSPVVLLHGGGADSAMLSWREAIPELAVDHVVYAPDWPGYGESQALKGTYTLDALVTCLHEMLDEWGLKKASLVGLSMGGGAAIGYALAHPGRLERLVLVDPYGLQKKAPSQRRSFFTIHFPGLIELTWRTMRNSRSMTRTALLGIFADPAQVTDELVEEIFAAIQDPKPGKSFHSFQRHEVTWSGARTYYGGFIAEISTPTLIIHGDRDTLVPLAEIRAAVEKMPDARLEVMENTGHWPPRENPEAFNRLVVDFLKGDSSGAV